jgi:small GTP-binding protein
VSAAWHKKIVHSHFAFDVFLSHSAKDKGIVRELAIRLANDGLKVWFEESQINEHEDTAESIREGLQRSRVLVLCISANALGSDWAELENYTFRFRDPLNKELRFIPLRLDDVPIKESIAHIPHFNWLRHSDREYSKLLEACSRPKQGVPVVTAKDDEPLAIKVFQLDSKAPIWSYSFGSSGKHGLTGSDEHTFGSRSPTGNVTLTGNTIRLWELETGHCLREFKGNKDRVDTVALSPDEKKALSGDHRGRVQLWDVTSGRRLRTLKGHDDSVMSVAWSADQSRALSGSFDKTVRVWEVATGKCIRVFKGHRSRIYHVCWSPDQSRALSASSDNTIRLWDIETGKCVRIFKGHMGWVLTAEWSPDQRFAVSGSIDKTIRLWDVENGRCLRVLEGHGHNVESLKWSGDQRFVLSGSADNSLRLWEIEMGRCLCVLPTQGDGFQSLTLTANPGQVLSANSNGTIQIWDLSKYLSAELPGQIPFPSISLGLDEVQYTNAKVLVVGESGAGKTGLTERLSRDSFTPSYSTSGAWSTQWPIVDLRPESGLQREVWLWDFGGQADQRLIHQLYLDKSALVLLVFNSDRDAVLPGLREWQRALQRSVPPDTPTFLVAGRTDVGVRFDREKVNRFANQNGFRFFETSAQSGTGCIALKKAIQAGIPWKMLERHTSPAIFKLLKDEILKLRDEGNSLLTFKELREMLRQRLVGEFKDSDLETVVSLLDGPGVVKELNFGTYILLRPEWINVYAQAVIRTLKAAPSNLGCLPVQSIAKGELVFQTTQADGKVVDEKRLMPHEETIVLQAMEQALIERKLCLRQGGQLVFPSYYGLEQPSGPMPQKYFISYVFDGFLDDIYATLIVRLAYCGAFRLKELWRDAADFETLAETKLMGVKLLRKEDASGELLVHFEKGVAPQERVIFAAYIHDHLKESAPNVIRLRFYVCPHCDRPVLDRDLAMELLSERGHQAKIICVKCHEYVPLWDDLEKRFASESVQKRVELLTVQENQQLDSRRKGKLLALEVMARITSANQKCFEIPGVEDEGLDIEVEFTDDEGRGAGKRLYLQLKAGNSYLQYRKRDGAEIFKIRKQNWVKYWLRQDCPVLLVIGTLPDEEDGFWAESGERFSDIRWMEISELLRHESKNGTQPVKQIVFQGERLDTLSVRTWRKRALDGRWT